jgi:hypothetical protein
MKTLRPLVRLAEGADGVGGHRQKFRERPEAELPRARLPAKCGDDGLPCARKPRSSGSRRETGTSPSGTVRTRPGIEPGRSRLALVRAVTVTMAVPGHRPDRMGDNDGMASDDSKAPSPLRLTLMLLLDGARPSGTLGWVSPVAPVVTQAAVGAGHWASGRRQRALAEWTGAAGFGLVAWGLGTEAPTLAEWEKNIQRLATQQRDLLRKLGTEAPATAGTETPTARRLSRYFRWSDLVFPVAGMVIGVPWRLRHPRRPTVLAIAAEAPNVVFYVLLAARAVQRRRPRIAAGSALVAAGSVARLRAAAAEPLR